MSATRLYQFLTAKPTRTQIWLWLGLSLLVSLVYSIPALQEAWSGEYVIQDDARQHVFWMRRFLDPDLFPQDLMADYFQSVAPWGYASLYRLFAWFGIDPVGLSKMLPLILGLITTGFCFGVALKILPIPIAGFTAATLLNQNLWMRDDLSSATPGAFFYPIFLAFLYYLLRCLLVPCLFTIALQGLFYPQGVFLSAGILLLRLLDWSDITKPRLNHSQIRFSSIGLGVAFLVMVLYAFKSSEFGSVIRLAEAKTLPAFAPTGWSAYFSDNFVQFWLCGKRSGMIPTEWCDLAKDQQDIARPWLLARFPSVWLGLLFPVVLLARNHFPLAQRLTHHWQVLWQALLVSIGLFLIAHVLAFRLHLPNRYTEHSFRILLALAAGITLVILWDRLFQWCLSRKPMLATGLTALLAATLVFYPYSLEIDHEPFPVTGYVTGDAPSLYRFFANQPKDIVIASLSEAANQIPTFSQRSLLAGGEGYLLPYHPQYFQQLSQKLLDTAQAQYSPDLNQVKAFIDRYDLDFWLLDQESFQPDFNNPKSYLTQLFAQFPVETQPIKAQLAAGVVPALSQIPAACSVQRDGFRVLRARCILKQ